MKHLLLPILLIFLLALPFTGCQKHYPVADKLSQAEIYMNEEPEAALRVLESIGQPDLHTKEHHARYACSIARHWTRIILTRLMTR